MGQWPKQCKKQEGPLIMTVTQAQWSLGPCPIAREQQPLLICSTKPKWKYQKSNSARSSWRRRWWSKDFFYGGVLASTLSPFPPVHFRILRPNALLYRSLPTRSSSQPGREGGSGTKVERATPPTGENKWRKGLSRSPRRGTPRGPRNLISIPSLSWVHNGGSFGSPESGPRRLPKS